MQRYNWSIVFPYSWVEIDNAIKARSAPRLSWSLVHGSRELWESHHSFFDNLGDHEDPPSFLRELPSREYVCIYQNIHRSSRWKILQYTQGDTPIRFHYYFSSPRWSSPPLLRIRLLQGGKWIPGQGWFIMWGQAHLGNAFEVKPLYGFWKPLLPIIAVFQLIPTRLWDGSGSFRLRDQRNSSLFLTDSQQWKVKCPITR